MYMVHNNTEQQGRRRTATTTDNQRHQPPNFNITQPSGSNHLDDMAIAAVSCQQQEQE